MIIRQRDDRKSVQKIMTRRVDRGGSNQGICEMSWYWKTEKVKKRQESRMKHLAGGGAIPLHRLYWKNSRLGLFRE